MINNCIFIELLTFYSFNYFSEDSENEVDGKLVSAGVCGIYFGISEVPKILTVDSNRRSRNFSEIPKIPADDSNRPNDRSIVNFINLKIKIIFNNNWKMVAG